MKKIMASLLFITSFLLSTNVLAEKLKIGVDYMMLTTDVLGLKAEPTAMQVKISNQVNPNFDVEGVFGIGISDDEFENCVGAGCSIELSSLFGVYGKLRANLSPTFDIYGKLGLAMIEGEDDTGASEDDTGLAFAFGAAFNVSNSTAITIEYNQLPDIEIFSGIDLETDSINIGFQTSL